MALIPISELTALAAAARRAHGASESMAHITAKCMVAADAQELATHGGMRVPSYRGHLESGRVIGAAALKIVNEKPAACLIHAGCAVPPSNARALIACAATSRARPSPTG